MTVRFKNELVRNITIKLGYANAKVCVYALLSAGTLQGRGGGFMFLTYSRFTSARTRLVHDRETTAHIAPSKITHHANDQAADTG